MPHAYTNIAFTPAVREQQIRMGSRDNYAPFDDVENRNDRIGSREAAFIAERDSFYQATVSETGWPYVQFRGGPAGFLRVLDPQTIGYADFRGNMQYISLGNFANNDRVSIILMDYQNRARLKLLGRVRIVGLEENPTLIAKLESPDYRARVQRGIIIRIEGFDWNCPQHITPRFTEVEITRASAPLYEEIARLQKQLADNPPVADVLPLAPLGKGPLALTIAGLRQLTPRVRAYELRSADGLVLPSVTPGAHIDVPVRIISARHTVEDTRRYSITSVSPNGASYEIAVQQAPVGSGGSAAVHRDFQLGTSLQCGCPGNDFELHQDHRPAVLIAGGIGITPIRTMAHLLNTQGRLFSLHFAARSRNEAAFADELSNLLGARMRFYASEETQKINVEALIKSAAPDSVFYVCGPASLISAVRDAASTHGVASENVRFEQFAGANHTEDQPIRVKLRRSAKVIEVGANQSILDAVRGAGIDVAASCRAGTCGTCAAKVIEGSPDHRDQALTSAERNVAGLMCICVSRATTPELVLDL